MSAIAVPSKSRFRVWPTMIFGLIGLNVCIVAITVYAATSDPSAVTEPDYYAKAVNFDATIRQREANTRLGWTASPSLRAGADGKSIELVVAVNDSQGRTINGAAVSAVAFANTRSGQRQTLTLASVDADSGRYVSPIRIDRSGLWAVRISVASAGETFTRETDLLVPGLPN